MVFVEGRMDVDQWEDKRSGAKRSRMKVVAENVQFLRIRRPEAEAPVPAPVLPETPAPARKPARTGRKTARGTA
jgi:single-stranded DNA-binding protein